MANNSGCTICHKITALNSPYCPQHLLLNVELPLERARRREAREQIRAYRKQQKAELAASPLAGFNPLFDEDERARLKAKQEARQDRRATKSRLIAAR